MSLYYTRHDTMTQATTTYAVIETGADGGTAGPIAIPPSVSMIKSITASVVINGAMTTNTGPIFVIKLHGTGALPDGSQELVISSLHLDDGGGTLTYSDAQIIKPLHLPVNIRVNPGADLSISAAYYGTDAGSPQISVELEFI